MRFDPKAPSANELDAACRICGSTEDLTFEHLPPKSAGNRERAEMLGIEAWLRREEGGSGERGTILQRGSGAYTLCATCNNRAGRLYVPELVKWTEAGNETLAQLDPSPGQLDKQLEPGYVHVGLRGLRPGRFMKQVATMLLALSEGGFPQANPELAAYAQDEALTDLPDRFQFYLALLAGPTARFNGGAAMWRENHGVLYTLELAFPPFSYILTVNEEAPALKVGNITSFTNCGIDQLAKIEVTLQLGFSHTPFPLDLRSKAALERDRAVSEAQAS